MAKIKKVLRIKTGEFLLKAHDNRIETTYKIQSAMDVSHWSFEQVAHVISNLHKVGYTSAEIVEYKEEE